MHRKKKGEKNHIGGKRAERARRTPGLKIPPEITKGVKKRAGEREKMTRSDISGPLRRKIIRATSGCGHRLTGSVKIEGVRP